MGPSAAAFVRFSVKGKAAGALDLHIQKPTAVPGGAVEHNDLVAARPAHHAGGILLARSLDHTLHLLAHEPLVLPRARGIHHFEQTLVSFLLHRLAHLLRHVRRRGVATWRIDRKSTRLNSSHLGISY